MSKKIDELKRTATDKPEPKVADTPKKDPLTEVLEKLKESSKELSEIDPKELKKVQDKLHEHDKKLGEHDETLSNHEGRIAKLEASASAPVVAAVGASASAPIEVLSDYDKVYPKAPVPHHVVKAYHIRLGTGVEILRYYEADAICIANTEEPGVVHTAVCVYAWADKDGLLIRPLTADESYRYRKL
ncbi:MAG: hypothetical protein Q4A70_01580 [Candidatus Saccharibacteria bacterium]|nr:hypothetical protein [Candidatus Saccharibacteria bacterium]